ncbi:GTP-binding protein LepA [Nocardioides sp. KIGAM211]|uniref:GTP-binding protein LepA n=1 Tax=Nocardioides luti TaxID=2761101 RepID=A0A7X0RGG7_9ACTN|nr:GTP-binding protein LepA [Nocardioides luti]MBB6627886.1 GTP-binding protein LepA [Nocardioides luti]
MPRATLLEASRTTTRLVEHVERLGAEHPPIELGSVDYTVHRPELFSQRFGHVLDYMARVELEVDRNVLELITLLPDPPEVDRRFYADVWQPQEIQHGLILDQLQVHVGRPPATPDLDTVGAKIKVLGALAHVGAIQDVVRMLYYLTGMATERSAVLAYNLLHDGVREMGETSVAETVIAPIRRQEPGHYAFYQLSAKGLWAELAGWQHWLVRRLRRFSFAPVGANDDAQKADFGEVMRTLGIDREASTFAQQISRVERELLWARDRGLKVPDYVAAAFREAVELAQARRAG